MQWLNLQRPETVLGRAGMNLSFQTPLFVRVVVGFSVGSARR